MASLATIGPTLNGSTRPAASPCLAADLSASGVFSRGGGSSLGTVTVTNEGAGACSLDGPLRTVRVRAVGGAALDIGYTADPRLGPDADPGTVAPALTLEPGATASASFLWQNQCAIRPLATRVLVRVPGETTWLAFDGPERAGLPRCDDQAQRSTITGFAFHQ